ncbi:hypothetical protein [Streptomyces sp. NPDC059063]|uniref:hypothetical protein n=1 Tax=unclassified Streptomyces TaxID=2593676 RepID=UPI00367A6316
MPAPPADAAPAAPDALDALDASDPADDRTPPPPPASARFPDVRPPVDRDWVLGAPRPAPDDTVMADLLAPFDRARVPTRAADPQDDPAPTRTDAADRDDASADAAADEAAGGTGAKAETATEAKAKPKPKAEIGAGTASETEAEAAADAMTHAPTADAAPVAPAARPAPPPPPASARLPDAPPPPAAPAVPPPRPATPPRPSTALPTDDADGTNDADGTGDVDGTDSAPPRTPAARRPVGAVDLTPRTDTGRPFVFLARPALYDDTTTRLRPVRAWARPRVAAAVACVVLGLGLIGGAVTGSWLTGESDAAGSARDTYAAAGQLWHSVPVDDLFPPTIAGEGAGPGGADRTWNRVAVAPDSGCKRAFDPLLRKALAPVGCLRLLRATYADATRSHVTTVGLLFTKADAAAMRALRTRFTDEGLGRRTDLMPRPYAPEGTLAAGFGDAQRATWTLSVLPDAPVVAYAVSGFADGRAVTEPQPAADAVEPGATTAPAQAGLGHDAKGIADRVERSLRKTATADTETSR